MILGILQNEQYTILKNEIDTLFNNRYRNFFQNNGLEEQIRGVDVVLKLCVIVFYHLSL